jgi:SAM-dependent methyltransferase
VTQEQTNVRVYDEAFFDAQLAESSQSAETVVPLLLELFPVRSVLDVGCGVGAWTAAFRANGVDVATGVDGEYIDRDRLLVPPEDFVSHDLTKPLDLGRAYDLVACLEVGEHLPGSTAPTLVATLTRHGKLLVFSAAVPGQGGTNHVNEQWPAYWRDLFAEHGYEVFDVLRPRLWKEERVGFWFRQNLLVFATGSAAERVRALPKVPFPLDIVHPAQFEYRNLVLGEVPGIRESLRRTRTSLRQLASAVRTRLS